MTPDEYLTLYDSWGLIYWPLYGIVNGACRCGNRTCDRMGKHGSERWSLLTEPKRPMLPMQNVGIACRVNMVVIDVDKGIIPEEITPYLGTTYRMNTSRGFHLWFAADPNRPIRSVVGWRYGVDIRAVGGMVVAAPSRHGSGADYSWDGVSPLTLTPLPESLGLLLPEHRKNHNVQSSIDPEEVDAVTSNEDMAHSLANQMQSVSENRNNELYRLTRTWATSAAMGLLGKDALAHLMVAAMETGLSREEVGRTVASALR